MVHGVPDERSGLFDESYLRVLPGVLCHLACLEMPIREADGVWMKSSGREAKVAEDRTRIHKDFNRTDYI